MGRSSIWLSHKLVAGWQAPPKMGECGPVVVGDGYGDPLCRDRDTVRWDIENEFLTA